MSSWSLAFLIIALLAALLGFAGLVGTAVLIAKLLFGIFGGLFLATLVLSRKRSSRWQR
jgi:uncharacterized membrane protein YtjA (UPF0391 family)